MKLQYIPMGELLNALILTVLPMLVSAGFWVWKGATPGKMLTGLAVVRADTLEPLGWGRALCRYLAYNLSFLTCGLGFAWAGWDARKRALHDHVTETAVVHAVGSKASPLKTLLLAGAAAALLAGAGIFFAKRWLDHNGDRIKAEGNAIEEEARVFGRAHTQAEALQEGLRRLDACGGFICEVQTRVFLKAALAEAAPSEGFCADVPSEESMIASAVWKASACEKIGRMGQQPCGR